MGVAVSDPSRVIASGLESITRATIKKDIQAVKRLVHEYEVEEIVVGLPKMMNGELGIQAKKVLSFVESLRVWVEIPVILWDERLTTVAAEKFLIEANMRRKKRKGTVDKVAATLILQGYLDSRTAKS